MVTHQNTTLVEMTSLKVLLIVTHLGTKVMVQGPTFIFENHDGNERRKHSSWANDGDDCESSDDLTIADGN